MQCSLTQYPKSSCAEWSIWWHCSRMNGHYQYAPRNNLAQEVIEALWLHLHIDNCGRLPSSSSSACRRADLNSCLKGKWDSPLPTGGIYTYGGRVQWAVAREAINWQVVRGRVIMQKGWAEIGNRTDTWQKSRNHWDSSYNVNKAKAELIKYI